MLLGYNTNGFAHHRLEDALRILADLGYASVAITLDHHSLNPFDPNIGRQCEGIRKLLIELDLRCVIETGARFLLDPRRKHQPTLVSLRKEDQERRLDFLRRAVDIAAELGAGALSFWSGTADEPAPPAELLVRLSSNCEYLGEYAEAKGIRLAFEPEPGMFIDTMDRFDEVELIVSRSNFGLTLDVGHLHCQGELPITPHIHRWKDQLWNVHLEDMRRGVHDHLMFGDGEMDFPPIFQALREIGYQGGVHVELSRHSHDAVNTATRALEFLRTMAAPS
ncbi:MAG: sugar phosphate isomerase/epimerase [Gemmataceae bacterium]|nr:sugar phosphate isomerase/epimerase [Gemmataceae bacterium]